MLKIVYKLLWLALGGGVLVALDQLIKSVVWMAQGPLELSPDQGRYWWLTWHQNHGISFGIELPYYLSVGLMVVFLLFLLWIFFQRHTRHSVMVLGLVLSIAGGLSNLIDRISLGFVRDFVALSPWLPVFNVADVLVVSGVILMLLITYRYGQP
ncbi:signal peptidase II [Patescibacteria group bacterium]|nr:signal peptidase II [Patescibacteria group bacterium]